MHVLISYRFSAVLLLLKSGPPYSFEIDPSLHTWNVFSGATIPRRMQLTLRAFVLSM